MHRGSKYLPNNNNFIFGHACKLLNTYAVRPGGGERTLRHPVCHHQPLVVKHPKP